MKKIKSILLLISLIIVLYLSLTGDIIYTNKGTGVSLLGFESIYVYFITTLIALYQSSKNKNSNISIIISLLTYIWTYYLVYQMIEYINEINILIDSYFYIYLSSSIFLIISLFINTSKNDENINEINNYNDILPNNLNKDNFIFSNFIVGIKEIPFNEIVLLVNNISDNTMDLIYKNNDISNTKKIDYKDIINISYSSKVRTSIKDKEVKENETKSLLLSTVMFGGSPIAHMLANSAFNTFFDSVTNNDDKVNFNVEFEIIINVLINGEEIKIILVTDTEPKEFINQILSKK